MDDKAPQSFFELILSALNSPLFLVLVSGVVVKIYLDSRNRKDKLREQQLKLIEDVAVALHKIFPTLFAEIKEKSNEIGRKAEIELLLKELFEIRFIVFAKSKAYFGKSDFFNEFDKLLWELDKIIKTLFECSEKIEKNNDLSNIARQRINVLINMIQKKQQYRIANIQRNDVYDELYIWTDIVWFQARNMLSDLLSENIRT